MKNKRKIIISIIAIALVLIAAITVVKYRAVINEPLKVEGEELIIVNEGDSFYSIINSLKTEDKIKSTLLIKLYTKLSKANVEVLPGEYVINGDMSINEVINTLTNESQMNVVAFTIPEGFTIDDIATKLEQEDICSKEEFINAVEQYQLPSYVKNDSNKKYNLEGYLFPDTYKFEKGMDPNYIIETMLNRFDEVLAELTSQVNMQLSSDEVEKVITIASMIEKEARVDEERAKIASVIYNRLDIEMPLQICATVIYAHGYHIDPVLEKHLEIDSPYNTYIYMGLPEGPISNPGVQSILAALKPESTDYLFYLLQDNNTHYFTDNYDDFLKKKEELGY